MDMDMAKRSPFNLPDEDRELLFGDEGFQGLRRSLAADVEFCAAHDTYTPTAQQTWLLHRDLLHALVMPVVELFKRASELAEAALCTRNPEDLELAFAGEARGAYICIQCFVEEEEDWCWTRGCPVCVTTATLSTESHIRLTIAAYLLSTSPTYSPATSPTSEAPTPLSTPMLPPLPHVLPALRDAVAADPFWGPDHWTHIFTRASQLGAGMQSLISQCMDLETLVLSPRPTRYPSRRRNHTLPMALARNILDDGGKGARVKAGQVAKRQLKMQDEQAELLRRCAMQCWVHSAVPSRARGDLLGRGEKRIRSLTCP